MPALCRRRRGSDQSMGSVNSNRQSVKVRLRWKLLLCAALASSAIYLPIIISGSEGWELTYWFCLLVIGLGSSATALILALTGKWRNGLLLLGMAAACILISFLLLWKSFIVRTYIRWAFHADSYKKEVLAQHDLKPGDLQHVEWDGWGWAGQDTAVYLVHDPQDRIRYAVQGKQGIKAENLSCEVSQVHRLEQRWYAVVFFTDTRWDNC